MARLIQGFSLTVLVDDACDPRINAVSRALVKNVGEAAGHVDPRVFVESIATMPGERTFVVSLQYPLASTAIIDAVGRALGETGAKSANNSITAFPEFEQFRVGDQLTFER